MYGPERCLGEDSPLLSVLQESSEVQHQNYQPWRIGDNLLSPLGCPARRARKPIEVYHKHLNSFAQQSPLGNPCTPILVLRAGHRSQQHISGTSAKHHQPILLIQLNLGHQFIQCCLREIRVGVQNLRVPIEYQDPERIYGTKVHLT